MKITKQLLSYFLFLGLLISCEENDPIFLEPVEAKTVSNLFAPQEGGQGFGGGSPVSGPFTLFDLDSGEITTDSTTWDIGFRGTTIIVNGGESFGTIDEPTRTGNAAVYITTGGFASVTQVDESLFEQDSTNGYAIPTGGGNGWYDYTPFPANLITPRTGVVLVVKTSEERYAKIEIVSYYKNAPQNTDTSVDETRYYTFNYVYQPNNNENTFD